jgi:hypothetical protein
VRLARHGPRVLLAGTLLALAGFGALAMLGHAPEALEAASAPTWRTLAAGPYSGFHGEGRFVLSDDASWQVLWARHASDRQPAPTAPAVDFARERVAALFVGERANGCHTLQILDVQREEGGLVVRYATHNAGLQPERLCAAVITHPHHILALPAAGGPVGFRAAPTP